MFHAKTEAPAKKNLKPQSNFLGVNCGITEARFKVELERIEARVKQHVINLLDDPVTLMKEQHE